MKFCLLRISLSSSFDVIFTLSEEYSAVNVVFLAFGIVSE